MRTRDMLDLQVIFSFLKSCFSSKRNMDALKVTVLCHSLVGPF